MVACCVHFSLLQLSLHKPWTTVSPHEELANVYVHASAVHCLEKQEYNNGYIQWQQHTLPTSLSALL